MAVSRISVTFNNREFAVLERLSAHTHRSKAELIRVIVEEYLRQNPDRFRLKTPGTVRRRQENIVLSEPTDPAGGADFRKVRKPSRTK